MSELNWTALQSALQTGLALKKAAGRIKEASGFEWIGEVPAMGTGFSSHALEQDYQMKHPVVTTMHPMTYGGAALGAAVAAYMGSHGIIPGKATHAALGGMVLGGTLGMGAEGAHRLHYLLNARKQLELGKNPTDPRYRL